MRMAYFSPDFRITVDFQKNPSRFKHTAMKFELPAGIQITGQLKVRVQQPLFGSMVPQRVPIVMPHCTALSMARLPQQHSGTFTRWPGG
jgi:hypothetical protein